MLTKEYVEVVGNTIYQAATISYVVKGDPEKVVVKLTGFAVFCRAPVGEEEAGKVARFEVYLDPAPLKERLQVAAEAKK